MIRSSSSVGSWPQNKIAGNSKYTLGRTNSYGAFLCDEPQFGREVILMSKLLCCATRDMRFMFGAAMHLFHNIQHEKVHIVFLIYEVTDSSHFGMG